MDFGDYASKSCLLLNVSTKVPKCDEACIVVPGEHPFIVDDSFVRYKSACVMSAVELEHKVAKGLFKAQPDASVALVRRVLACMDVSDFAPGGMIKLSSLVWNRCKGDGYW